MKPETETIAISSEDSEARRQFHTLLAQARGMFEAAPLKETGFDDLSNQESPLRDKKDKEEILEKINEAWRYAQNSILDERMRAAALEACDHLTVQVTGKPGGGTNHDPEETHGTLRKRFFEDGNF